MHPNTPRRRQARPVADVPIDVLLERAEALAKGWLLELLDQQPLARAPAVLAADLAGDGPALCAALVRSLGADRELERIAAGGELEQLAARTGELAGARNPEEASRAVDALRAVIWSAALSTLPDPDADQVARLAERLTLVSELTRGAVLRKLGEAREPSRGREPPSTGVFGALEDAIARSRREGAVLSLLLIELEEAERILAVELEQHAATIFDRFATTLRASTRPGDVVVREGPARAWVIAPGTDREGALELGAELARAVAGAEPWRGAPLRAAVGTAVLGEQGEDAAGLIETAEDAAGLIETAEEERFAAAARGIEITRATPEHAGD